LKTMKLSFFPYFEKILVMYKYENANYS